jgi:hypothetical protein
VYLPVEDYEFVTEMDGDNKIFNTCNFIDYEHLIKTSNVYKYEKFIGKPFSSLDNIRSYLKAIGNDFNSIYLHDLSMRVLFKFISHVSNVIIVYSDEKNIPYQFENVDDVKEYIGDGTPIGLIKDFNFGSSMVKKWRGE